MAGIVTGDAEIRYDRLAIIPLGGQSELGQVLWVFSWGGDLLLVDAGAGYPEDNMPGVDLLLPNTNFLEANQDRILALLLTNGHEEHCGAVNYLLNHIKIPQIMAPRFVSSLVSQTLMDKNVDTVIDTIEPLHPYQIGSFNVEWIPVNDAIADACALKIGTPEGTVIYTSSFKLDQTPVDNRLLDVGRLAHEGDNGVLLLMSNSAGVEQGGYTPSEKAAARGLEKHVGGAPGRVIVVLPGTNTHRLQILFNMASRLKRRVVLFGDTLLRTAVAAAVTGNLTYDRKIEATQEDISRLADSDVLVVATGHEGDPLQILHELAYDKNPELKVKEGDTVIYSAEVEPGTVRRLAMMLDQFLAKGVRTVVGSRDGVHVSKHASREELKLMLTITKPKYFIPMLGEGRHIMHHAQLAVECGLNPDSIYPIQNGEIFEVGNGLADVIGEIESASVLYDSDQGERVTTYSVNERRNLSLAGVLTVSCVIGSDFELISGPTIEAQAAGFMQSSEWVKVRPELAEMVVDTIASFKDTKRVKSGDLNGLRSAIREAVTKAVRSRLQSKPMIQVVVHEAATTRPE